MTSQIHLKPTAVSVELLLVFLASSSKICEVAKVRAIQPLKPLFSIKYLAMILKDLLAG